jgi:hypothetical protein
MLNSPVVFINSLSPFLPPPPTRVLVFFPCSQNITALAGAQILIFDKFAVSYKLFVSIATDKMSTEHSHYCSQNHI